MPSPHGRVEPRLAKGMQDLAPPLARERQDLVDRIRLVYESYGFAPLVTPAIEHWDTLIGPADAHASDQVFKVDSPEEDALGLRFDLTVPLARWVAQNRQVISRPFRRYQVASVWRKDKPGPGRLREFVQFDVDVVGTTSRIADAEIVAAMSEVFRKLIPDDARGPRFQVRFSDRRVLDLLLSRAGIAAAHGPAVLRVLDKLERVGMQKVGRELTTGYTDDSGDRIPGLGLSQASVETIQELMQVATWVAEATAAGRPADVTRRAVLSKLESFFSATPDAARTLQDVAGFCDLLDAMGVDDAHAVFDVSIARGLAYYTGPVFETRLRDAHHLGSVCSGGRYDDLVGRFCDDPWPGVGASVGVDRLLAALAEVGDAPSRASGIDVLVTAMDARRLADYIALAAELRAAGLRTELFSGSGGLGKQLKHADRVGAAVAVIAGEDELAAGEVTVKAMAEPPEDAGASREEWLAARVGQRRVPRSRLVAAVRETLGDRCH